MDECPRRTIKNCSSEIFLYFYQQQMKEFILQMIHMTVMQLYTRINNRYYCRSNAHDVIPFFHHVYGYSTCFWYCIATHDFRLHEVWPLNISVSGLHIQTCRLLMAEGEGDVLLLTMRCQFSNGFYSMPCKTFFSYTANWQWCWNQLRSPLRIEVAPISQAGIFISVQGFFDILFAYWPSACHIVNLQLASCTWQNVSM